ncbi:ComF family protein [Campylobacter devanensis]|uniref:ComF family protein n=1 Tax=Campylobacter devanensis TaxID=3161138 RepID=UPI000A34FDDA|nr:MULTISPECIES: ComF family protein [unclassified Campylobacter]
MEILRGNWKCGWALDLHTSSSKPLGDGHYDNIRTEIGQMLYDLKYNNSISNQDKIQLVEDLAFAAANFLKNNILVTPYIWVIVPTPSSKDRELQPVYLLADKIAYLLNRRIDGEYIKKIKNTNELKSIEILEERKKILDGAFICDKRYKGRKILLIDDLYRSGATLNEIAKTLYTQGEVDNVYVLCFTKTRSKK